MRRNLHRTLTAHEGLKCRVEFGGGLGAGHRDSIADQPRGIPTGQSPVTPASRSTEIAASS
jgi:hypothetical protein